MHHTAAGSCLQSCISKCTGSQGFIQCYKDTSSRQLALQGVVKENTRSLHHATLLVFISCSGLLRQIFPHGYDGETIVCCVYLWKLLVSRIFSSLRVIVANVSTPPSFRTTCFSASIFFISGDEPENFRVKSHLSNATHLVSSSPYLRYGRIHRWVISLAGNQPGRTNRATKGSQGCHRFTRPHERSNINVTSCIPFVANRLCSRLVRAAAAVWQAKPWQANHVTNLYSGSLTTPFARNISNG